MRPEELVNLWCRDLGKALGSQVSAALVGPVKELREVQSLREQAALVLAASRQPEGCATLEGCRATLLLDHACRELETAPTFMGDLLAPLLVYDARRSTSFASALLAWLDEHGDIAVAAHSQGVHPNTLRYRIGRAQAILGLDFEDRDVRLAVHLRLRGQFVQTGVDPGLPSLAMV